MEVVEEEGGLIARMPTDQTSRLLFINNAFIHSTSMKWWVRREEEEHEEEDKKQKLMRRTSPGPAS